MVFAAHFFWLIILFAAQTTYPRILAAGGVTPDLILIYAVYCGVQFEGNAAVGMGFFSGFVQDCLSGRLLGINTLSKSVISFLFSALRNKIVVDSLLPVCLFVFAASFFDGLVFFTVWVMLLKGEANIAHLVPSFLIYAVYNAIMAPPLFWVLNRSNKWFFSKFPSRVMRSS